MDAFLEKQTQEMKTKDSLNHILGQYISIAFNNSKKYPDKPFLSDIKVKEEIIEQSSEDMEKIAKINTILLGGVING